MIPADYFKTYQNIFLVWMCSNLIFSCHGLPAYSSVSKLFEDKLGPGSGYNHAIRPLLDQAQRLEVNVTFDIIAIVNVNAKKQEFIVNGFLGLYWTDELLTWQLTDYNYTYLIHPYPNQIWRPRLVLANTLEDRDLFEDDYSPVTVVNDGSIVWLPGSLFPTSCKLDLYRYPFDRQTCFIDMYSMGLSNSEILFKPYTGTVSDDFYVESGEWKIEGTKIESGGFNVPLAYFRIRFYLIRLPGFFVLNIVIPIVLMSFLNILVFAIPVDSGEKISYGITVLLALTVFMSIVSDQLPRSSDTLPLVTIYLVVLTIISVCTVIMSIIIVYCHHREEKETTRLKATSNFRGLFHKINIMNRTATNFTKVQPVQPADTEKNVSDETDAVLNVINKLKNSKRPTTPPEVPNNKEEEKHVYVNRWKQIGKHLDVVSFIVFMVIWVSVTIVFLVEMSK